MTLCWARAIPALVRNGARPTTVPQTITCVLRRSLAVGALTLFQTSDASPSTRPLYSYIGFGRSLKHLVNALADLCAYGVAFVSFRDNLDLSTPSGRLMFQIIGAMAEFERSLIRERVKAGLRNARAKGKKFGRPRAQVDAARVASLRSDGLSWSQVCRTLNVSKGSAQRSVARRTEEHSGT
jgi:resolvase-like protein